ncbi:nuclear transport factor 2 family protein [Euzebya tangerina]|uniref:nuclear transport factor 2 family protein n=1 Tax=Euzebya tangerina TaxID=591198 RepID=UPI00196A57E3|nr:nuclear transport factor 2 family protein [Euzebya tangerina]
MTASSHSPDDAIEKVKALLKSLETGAEGPPSIIDDDTYIQHNLTVPDGKEGFLGLQRYMSSSGATHDVVRAFRDGAHVFTHAVHNFGSPGAGFDIFRFEDGKIVEHWDNNQPSGGPNPSGRTMTDGPTEATDLDKTDANKDLVRAFVTDVLVNNKMDALAGYFDGDTYIQHNPEIADGVSSLGPAFAAMAENGKAISYDTIELVLGQGDFVMVGSLGKVGDAPTAFYDLFRVADGKIAEHWDAIETIPPRDEWANPNGKF